MILQCEACGTKFAAPDDAFADGGRQVRCAICKHSWFFDPAASLEAAPKIGQDAASAEIASAPATETPETPMAAPSAKRYAAARASMTRRRFHAGPPRWLSALSVALFLIVCGLAALNFMPGLVGFRPSDDFVLQGLVFRPLQSGKGYIVTGTVVNKGEKALAAPKLRLALLDDKGKAVKLWQRDLNGASIEGGGRLAFTADGLEAPPDAKISDPHMRVELGNALELALRRTQ